jgi:Thioredoxin
VELGYRTPCVSSCVGSRLPQRRIAGHQIALGRHSGCTLWHQPRALRPWPGHRAIRSDNDPATRVVDRNVAAAKIDPGTVERFRRVGGDLRLLIVAEDWCPDSVHTVPYVAALAAQAGVDMRIVDRGSGAAMMKRHPPPDGRGVTPIVVLLRRGIDVGAWVERPSVLQSLFQSIGTNPEIWSSSLLKEHRSSR